MPASWLAPEGPLARLPKELFIYIGAFLSSDADFNALAQTNSTFHHLLNKQLYRRNVTRSHASALFWAATHGCRSTAAQAIEAGADVQATTDIDPRIKGSTSLMLAAVHGQHSVLTLLLSHDDINPNSRDRKYIRPPLGWAIKEGHRDIVETLLGDDRVDVNLQDKSGDTPLMIAVIHRPALLTLLLCSQRADPRIGNRQGNTPLSRISRQHEEDAGLLLATHLRLILDGDNSAAHCQHVFFYAAIMGHVEIVAYLVSFFGEKLDPNCNDQMYGRGAFTIAASSGRVDVVRFLLSWKPTNPNLREPWKQHTPLFVAAMNGQQEIVDVLVGNDRVDLEIPDVYGTTPLGVAADRNHLGIVKKLLAGPRRANPNARDDNGQTPLFSAGFYGHLDIVRLLLEADGIDPQLGDSDGQTPMEVAAENGNYQVVETLRKYMANAS
ncbi:hypothetical protein NUU61_000651 [Penicillium alfredii]|uniref:F-box domain-containing protein n=1 Tax=Penicillium alfredii TaxID=1506179 RepID=A0A9W9GB68_9EURO|nr:uncharacterized protein NUU61_000651 [Penicillium alfredii]KAJ5114892.1 hypothetical protein NUU61_000651 [Penicillium alfredii]